MRGAETTDFAERQGLFSQRGQLLLGVWVGLGPFAFRSPKIACGYLLLQIKNTPENAAHRLSWFRTVRHRGTNLKTAWFQ